MHNEPVQLSQLARISYSYNQGNSLTACDTNHLCKNTNASNDTCCCNACRRGEFIFRTSNSVKLATDLPPGMVEGVRARQMGTIAHEGPKRGTSPQAPPALSPRTVARPKVKRTAKESASNALQQKTKYAASSSAVKAYHERTCMSLSTLT